MQDLLLLHGAIGAKDQLQPLAQALKDRYRVHTLNFSGHGGEEFPNEAFSIPLFASEILNYIQEHKIEGASVFGYSMGGYAAMRLAKQYPGLVGMIITLATKFYWDDAIAANEVKMLDAETILQKVPAFAAQLEQRHLPNDWKIVLSKTKDMLLELGRNNCLSLPDYKSIRNPCLLLLGDKDRMVTEEETLAVQQQLPNASFQLIPGTPHPLEQANIPFLASLIGEFINKQ